MALAATIGAALLTSSATQARGEHSPETIVVKTNERHLTNPDAIRGGSLRHPTRVAPMTLAGGGYGGEMDPHGR